jgi:hypothetical protein
MKYYSAIKKNKIIIFAGEWKRTGDDNVDQDKTI